MRELFENSITPDGSVKCLLCPDVITKPCVTGVDLVKQLASCSEYLYPNSKSVVVFLDTNVDCVASSSAYATPEISSTTIGDKSMSDLQFTVCCNACEGNDVISEASHHCSDCDGLPLCLKHVEKHPMTSFCSGHHVTLRTNQECCLLHTRYDVISFCRVCDEVLCHQCQITSHGDHDVIDLETAAEEKYSSLQKACIDAGMARVLQADVTGNESAASISFKSRSDAVEKSIIEIESEAQAASAAIDATFHEIDGLVTKAKQRRLGDINKKLWADLKPLEVSRKRLGLLDPKETAMRRLAGKVKSQDANPVNVIRSAEYIIKTLNDISWFQDASSYISTRSNIHVTAQSLGDVDRALEGVLSFGTISSVTGLSKPQTTSLSVTAEAGLLAGLPIILDPTVCSPTIRLSENWHVATQTRSADDEKCDVAIEGFSAGCHSWNVVHLKGTAHSRSGKNAFVSAAGVRHLPPRTLSNYDPPKRMEYGCCWDYHGKCYWANTRIPDLIFIISKRGMFCCSP